MSGAPSGSGGEAPTLRVVRGDPSAAELAALVAVLWVAAGTAAPPPPRTLSEWASPKRAVRAAPHPGRGAWRAGSWPH